MAWRQVIFGIVVWRLFISRLVWLLVVALVLEVLVILVWDWAWSLSLGLTLGLRWCWRWRDGVHLLVRQRDAHVRDRSWRETKTLGVSWCLSCTWALAGALAGTLAGALVLVLGLAWCLGLGL